MVFPFGISISDFIEGIKQFKNAIKALSDTRGARADYMELSRSLDSLDKALSAASAVVLDTDTRREALKQTVEDCQKCVTSFLVDIAKFEPLRNQKASKRDIIAAFRKIKWATCKQDDVKTFRSQIEMHVGALDMLLLTFQVESLMRVSTDVEKTNKLAIRIENQTRDCLAEQKAVSEKVVDGHEALTKKIASLEEGAASRTVVSKEEGNILLDIQRKLQSALSPEDQQMVFHIVQETLKKNDRLEQQIEELKGQNECLERHVLEIKASVQMQRAIPPQVLLQQPVILHDALGRIAPFHLEFITSAAALTAVLKVRFQNVGLEKIISNEYNLRDANKQTDIDIYKPWETVFLPGQNVEMSMLFLVNRVRRYHCPGCSSHSLRQFKAEEQVKCPKCPMIYRRTRRAVNLVSPQNNGALEIPIKTEPDDISSFCRVDVVERKKPKTQSIDGGGHGGSFGGGYGGKYNMHWYCCNCYDGPMLVILWPACSNCGHSQCTGCTYEALI